MYNNYVRGLQALKNLLPDDAQGDFALYEARLMENLQRERRYGSNENVRSERSSVIEELNQLAKDYGVTPFNDLCFSDHATGADSRSRSSATSAGPATGTQQTPRKAKPALPTQPELRVTPLTHTVPTAYYRYLDVERFPLVKVQVDNSGPGCDDVTLTVSTVIEGYSDTSTTTFKVKRGERREKALMPLLQASAIKALDNVQRVTLRVTVGQNVPISAVLDERTEHMSLLARNVALLGVRGPDGDIRDLTDFLAAWVTPYPLPIQRWLRAAAKKLPDANSGFVGYREGNTLPEIADNVRTQARAIFQVLKEQSDIQYKHLFASQGATDDQITQRVQLPVESLITKFADCIESSVLFASLLEAAAIDPVIVIIPGHAFVGWHIDNGAGQYEFLDTTKIVSENFETAQKIAQDYFEQAQQAGYFQRELFDPRGYARIIDIVSCRREGIYSLESEWDRDTALSGPPQLDTVSANASHSPSSRSQPQTSVSRVSHMTSLNTDLNDRYRKILLASGMCDSAGKLRSLFVGELASYRHSIPEGNDAQDRASQLIAYLDGRKKQGRPILLILLENLRPLIPDDDLLDELDQLHRDMENA